jgi:GT2 family glycosyltransferase
VELMIETMPVVGERPDLGGERLAAPCPDCAIVVVTHNSGEDIDRLLGSLPAAAPGLDLQVIVVDTASSDDTVWRAGMAPGVEVVEAGANVGYAAGINLGRALVPDGVPVLVLNADLRLAPWSITRMLEVAADPTVGVVAPQLLGEDGEIADSLRRDPSLARALGDALFGRRLPRRPGWFGEIVRDPAAYRRAHDVDWAVGAAYLVSAACDAEVGPWAEHYFLYSEEVDYCARVRDAGYRVVYVPEARAVHREGGSGRRKETAALLALNRVRFFRSRHGAWATAAFWSIVVLAEALRSGDAAHRFALRTLLDPWTARRVVSLLGGVQR